jgi:hypothetical protein
MVQNRIVVRIQNGNVLKGFAADFMPNKDVLHLAPGNAQQPGSPSLTVNIKDCKALFFVKDFECDPTTAKKRSSTRRGTSAAARSRWSSRTTRP